MASADCGRLIGTVAVLVAARLIAILLLGLLDRAVQFGRGQAPRHPGLQARAWRISGPDAASS